MNFAKYLRTPFFTAQLRWLFLYSHKQRATVVVTFDRYKEIHLNKLPKHLGKVKRLHARFIYPISAILKRLQRPSCFLLKKLNNLFLITLERQLNYICKKGKFAIFYVQTIIRSFLLGKKYLTTMKKLTL